MVADESAVSLYADDIAILAIGDDRQEMTKKLQDHTNALGWWCQRCRLSVHIGMSKVMDIFQGRSEQKIRTYMDGTI